MEIDRREFLGFGAAAMVWGRCVPLHAGELEKGAAFVSAARLADRSYAIVVVGGDGALLRTIPLSGRGHDIAVSPDRTMAVAFARRPGRFAVAFDTAGRKAPDLFRPPSDRHFYGHGVFSPDGRLLYATENDFENAVGVLGVYDVGAGFNRLGELSTHGTGPHDLLAMPDGRTLCVANGGIETHPAAGRAKLNIATMRPSLVFIDRQTGDLITRHELRQSIHKLSIRHLCCDERGDVWFGGQWQGSIDEAPWLVGRAGRDVPIQFSSAPEDLGTRLKGYIGSVSASADGRLIAVSAPRAGRILFLDAARGGIVSERTLRDGCGVASHGQRGFAVSSGLGVLDFDALRRSGEPTHSFEGLAFDNHLRIFPG